MPFEIGNIYKKKGSFGLDIGTHSIKVCQLKKDGKLVKLVGYGETSIADNIIIEGIISDPDAVADSVKKIIKETPWGKITANRAVASLPESKIFTRILDLPEMSNKEIDEAVHWEAEQYVPVPISDLYIDWEVIRPDDAKKKMRKRSAHASRKRGSLTEAPPTNEILLVATPKSIVDSYLQVFKKLEIEPMAIEMSLAAVTRSLVKKDMNQAILIANVGANATDVGIALKRVLRLSGSTPTGGDNLTESLTKKLKVSIREADEIKKKYGLTEWNLKAKVMDALEPGLNIITGEIEKIMKYYDERLPEAKDNPVSQILLTGGTANMPGLANFIQEKLKVPTEIGNPWTNIAIYPLKPVPKAEVSLYSTAIGLALRGIEENE